MFFRQVTMWLRARRPGMEKIIGAVRFAVQLLAAVPPVVEPAVQPKQAVVS